MVRALSSSENIVVNVGLGTICSQSLPKAIQGPCRAENQSCNRAAAPPMVNEQGKGPNDLTQKEAKAYI